MPKAGLAVKIENVVASGAMKHRIDLNAVVQAFPEAEYRPGRFPGVVFRLKRPSTTFLIFGNGKLVCVGARSEKEAKMALHELVRKLKGEGIPIVGKAEIQVKNVVASASLGGSVDLLQLYESTREMRGGIMYEPEQFPGLIYRMDNPKAVFLIYSNGKIVCVGARKEKDVYHAVLKLHQQLKEKKLIYHR
ncbi:MAG: TATA-box-binding protein [Candidatus Bathyarchaeia archaeon]